MAVGGDDDVDLLRLIAGCDQEIGQLAGSRHAGFAVAAVEQHELLARIDQRVDVDVFHFGWGQALRLGVGLHGLGRLIVAEGRVRGALHVAVEEVGDLESPELEAIDGGPHHAQHGCCRLGRAGEAAAERGHGRGASSQLEEIAPCRRERGV